MKLEKKVSIALPTGVLGLTGNPDGSRLYAACMDGRIYEVNTESREVTPLEHGHTSYASGCALLPDGTTLVSAGYDGILCWQELTSRRLIRRVPAHDFWSWQMALAPDGKSLASVSGQFLVGGEKYEPANTSTPTVKVHDANSENSCIRLHTCPRCRVWRSVRQVICWRPAI